MNKNLFHKFVSVLILFTFLYPTILPAVEFQDKLAAYSRFTAYFSPDGKNAGLLTPDSMQVFVNAMVALNRVMLDPSQTPDSIRASIGSQNEALRPLGVVIDNNIQKRRIGSRDVPYLVLAFGEGRERDLFFLGDYDNWTDSELAEIGVVTPKHKENLRVPGVQGSWLTGHKEITVGLAAGQEAGNPAATLLDLITADIYRQLNTSERRRVLRRKTLERAELWNIRSNAQTRLQEIKLAIEEEIFNLVRVHITARLLSCPTYIVTRDDEEDYFARPSTTRRGEGRAMVAELPSQPIQDAYRFKQTLGELVADVINNVPAGRGKTLIEIAIGELNAKAEDGHVAFSFHDHNRGSVVGDVFREAGLFTLLRNTREEDLMEMVFEHMTNSLLVNPDISTDELDAKKARMLERIEGRARGIGFTDISSPIQTDNTNVNRIFEVPFRKTYSARHGRRVFKVARPEGKPEGIILNVFDHTLTRLVALAELLGDEFVDGFLQNILIVEMARAKYAEEFMQRTENVDLPDDQNLLRAALSSYLAMIHRDGRILDTVAEVEEIDVSQLKENWRDILAQYFWIAHIYGNPEVDISNELTRDEEGFTRVLVRDRLRRIIPRELVSDDDKIARLASNIAPRVWAIHQRFIDALDRRALELMPPDERGLAAGEEMVIMDTGSGPKRVLGGDFIVLDYLMSNEMIEYIRDPDTGRIREINRDPLGILVTPLRRLSGRFEKVLKDNKLQLVFTQQPLQPGWGNMIEEAASVIAANLEAVKRPNSVVQGEGLTLRVDADGIIYVMPGSGASDIVIANLERQVQDALRVQSDAARIEKSKPLRGFIDIDSRIFAIQNPYFQEILYRRLQELYNEGLYVVRVVGEPGQMSGNVMAIMADFSKRAGSDEWAKVSPSPTNTVTLVSSDNTALADERQAASTVIRLGFDGAVNMPQIFPALTIARAIISVGGEQNVTPDSSLFRDIKVLYLSMVGEAFREDVNRATTIAQLLAIILPPITAEDLRIYEYLLIGRKVAEVAA